MKKHLTKYAKILRKNSTDVEKKMWYILKDNFSGCKFRRQQPIGSFIVDFVCFSKKLIIELDGGQHNFVINEQKDRERDKWLNKEGFTVLRFWNNEVNSSLDSVVEEIWSYL